MHWITSTIKPPKLEPNQVYCNLLTIHKIPCKVPKQTDIAIFTSQHAVIDCNFDECFVVGQKTANRINKNCKIFTKVADLKCSLQDVVGKKISYFRGVHITESLNFLAQNNIYNEFVTYEAREVETLPSDIVDALKNGKITKIYIYSNRSYSVLKNLIEKYNIDCSGIELDFFIS